MKFKRLECEWYLDQTILSILESHNTIIVFGIYILQDTSI